MTIGQQIGIGFAVLAVAGLSWVIYRNHARADREARERFDAAMREVAARMHIEYRAADSPGGWAGATGMYQGFKVSVFVVSQESRGLQTGVLVQVPKLDNARLLGLAQEDLPKVRTEARRAQTAPEKPSRDLVQSLSTLASEVDGIEIDASGILVLATTPRLWHDFWNLTMETDANRLCGLVEKAQRIAAQI